MLRHIPATVLAGAAALLSLFVMGTLGFHFVEDYPWGDAFFMTITTISTVGYREIHPLGTGGRIVASALIIGGVGVFFYFLTSMVQYTTGGAVRRVLEERRMHNTIASLRGHFVLCGFGRVGEEVAADFRARSIPFVVIDSDPERAADAREARYLVIEGDATEDDVLREARIEHARGLVAATGGDAQNTYITLSARAANPDAIIIARASHRGAEAKMAQAGANQVISPYAIGGRRMALAAVQPLIVDFMETVAGPKEGDRILAELEVREGSSVLGSTIAEACSDLSIIVVAVARGRSDLRVGPGGDYRLATGDRLIVMGKPAEIERFAQGSAGPRTLSATSTS